MALACSALIKSLAALCFPPRCLSCNTSLPGNTELLFCTACLAAIDFIRAPLCPICGRPFPDAVGSSHPCGNCLTNPPHFNTARAVAHYCGPLADAIHGFKYSGRTFGLATFALLARQLAPPPAMVADCILPVPLHPQRLRQRGFNQALLLARALFPDQQRLIDAELLVRSRWTEPQTTLSGEARRRNLNNAFAVTDPARIKGRNVLLVDDVFTTGSTVNECARCLRKAGSNAVHILTLARVKE